MGSRKENWIIGLLLINISVMITSISDIQKTLGSGKRRVLIRNQNELSCYVIRSSIEEQFSKIVRNHSMTAEEICKNVYTFKDVCTAANLENICN